MQGDIRKSTVVNISDALKVSFDSPVQNTQSQHGWLDENGWITKRCYVLDEGIIYPADLRIANTRDGRHILYAVNVKKKDGVTAEKEGNKKVPIGTELPSVMDNKLSSAESQVDENGVSYSLVTDDNILSKLNSEKTVKVYRAMQVIDGKLYPPMAASVGKKLVDPIQIGKWEQADEHPELIKVEKNAKGEEVYKGETTTVSENVDYAATTKKIISETDQKAYIKWAEELFNGAESQSGIWNGKDYYTSSGNRKTFKQTHMPITLENIVKIMRQGEQSGVAFAGSNIVGASDEQYESIADMKKQTGRLNMISNEAFNEQQRQWHQKFSDLASRLAGEPSSSKYMFELDSAQNIMAEAVSRYGTNKEQLANYIKREGKGWTILLTC